MPGLAGSKIQLLSVGAWVGTSWIPGADEDKDGVGMIFYPRIRSRDGRGMKFRCCEFHSWRFGCAMGD